LASLTTSTTAVPLRARWTRTTHLVRGLAVREFRARYRQSFLEIAWSLITPVVLLAVYGIILTRVFRVSSPGVPYLSFVWTGMVVWMMFASAVGGGVHSIIGNRDLISKIYFPREALPLAVVGAAFLDLLIGVAVLIPLVAVQVGLPSWTAVAAIPGLIVAIIWIATFTTFVAALAVFVRDVAVAMGLVLQVGFFATPIMYPSSVLPDELQWLNRVNPLAVCIDALRASLLLDEWPDWTLLGTHAAIGVVCFLLVVLYVRSVETRMADVV
ncbi:MAG: ABC transporter permease, partial [Actinomycetes bacterium]